MEKFACTRCGFAVYFENVQCLNCKSPLGFLPDRRQVVALAPTGSGRSYKIAGKIAGRQAPARPLAYCANAEHGACNWLTEAQAAPALCTACMLNRTIPNLADNGSLEAWRELERAKKRLVYSLLRYKLPLDATRWGKGRLAFDFMKDTTTGHLNGVITIDIAEADAVERVRQRQLFGEPYRTLLGHLRHESGHFYWMVLIEAAGRLEGFRLLFGDEREPYGDALARHHANGPPADWEKKHVSAYASAHPWEDWAETWAHYLHLVDAIDTAEAEGVKYRRDRGAAWLMFPTPAYDSYAYVNFDDLMKRWINLTIAINSLTRSIGRADFYPFVVPAAAYQKLEFVHHVVHGKRPQ
ncbi:MAG: putative zinc-binding metallopeptidase [Hyphomicrobiaceae bacterium]|nr:putative zinc-binding metallopeptidase [Hyphomicrobiaceae bacterium]